MINRVSRTHPSPSPVSFENKTSHSHRDLNEKNHPLCKGLWVIFSQKGFENSVASYLSMPHPRVRHRKKTKTKQKNQIDLQEIALRPLTSWSSTRRAGRGGRQRSLGNKQKRKRRQIQQQIIKHNQSGILANTVWYKNLNVHVYTFQK